MDDFHPETPQSLRELDLPSLVGLTEDEARQLVEDAGGYFRPYGAMRELTFDFNPRRVTARIDDGWVVEVRGFS